MAWHSIPDLPKHQPTVVRLESRVDDIGIVVIFGPTAPLATIRQYLVSGCADMTPRTTLGRVLSIPYAVVGIPLAFYFLSRAGRDLGVVMRLFYIRICCDLIYCKLCQRRQRRKLYESAVLMTSLPQQAGSDTRSAVAPVGRST